VERLGEAGGFFLRMEITEELAGSLLLCKPNVELCDKVNVSSSGGLGVFTKSSRFFPCSLPEDSKSSTVSSGAPFPAIRLPHMSEDSLSSDGFPVIQDTPGNEEVE
jgi:hypothetical protein